MNPRHTYVLRMGAANLAAAAFVSIAFFGAGTQGSPRHAVEAFAVALVFATCIGVPSAIMIPRLSKPLWQFRFPINWIGLVAAMFMLAMAGSALAIAILAGVGYIPVTAFGAWFAGSIRYAIITTLIFGISISAYEMLRGRLDQALLDVRTKERDEAEARRLAAEAQLASLESRVQPHFLFNTLNSIASLISSDPSGAEKMTGQLAGLLRSSLDGADRPLVLLVEELVTVREYLDIERVRFGDRLRCSFDVTEEAQAVRLPRFSLQTVVENAVKYAISPRRDGGSVAIRARLANGRVRIEVLDDGAGFDAAAIPPNHGLDALRQRLALTFGSSAQLQIHSSTAGTTVTMDIPRLA